MTSRKVKMAPQGAKNEQKQAMQDPETSKNQDTVTIVQPQGIITFKTKNAKSTSFGRRFRYIRSFI